MTSSINDPRSDFEINALGSLNVLESVRHYAPECITIYSSTNKVYGDLAWVQFDETATRYTTPSFPNGFDEATPLDFRSPYGCSKGAADQYFLDYARIYNLRTVVFRHSSIYGGDNSPPMIRAGSAGSARRPVKCGMESQTIRSQYPVTENRPATSCMPTTLSISTTQR